MAFNALNSPAPMNMPDFEDASPPHFRPDGAPATEPVGIFAAMQNAKEIHEGRWDSQPYEVVKKGKTRHAGSTSRRRSGRRSSRILASTCGDHVVDASRNRGSSPSPRSDVQQLPRPQALYSSVLHIPKL
jgi:malate synthase